MRTSWPPERLTVEPRGSRALLGPVATVLDSVDTGSWRTVRPDVDISECIGCGVCGTYCPTAVIEMREEQQECVVIDWAFCKGCGICANVCPRRCIEMVPERNQDAD
jgi:pyruvate ferredoxin oxidoreductase delta subunit